MVSKCHVHLFAHLFALLATLSLVGCSDSPTARSDQRLPDAAPPDQRIDRDSEQGVSDGPADLAGDTARDLARVRDLARDSKAASDIKLFDDQRLTDGPRAEGLAGLDLPLGCAAVIGLPCTSAGQQCGSTATCLLTSSNAGVCVCPCTADDPLTPLVDEDSCPDRAQNICSPIRLSNGVLEPFCLRRCSPRLGASDCAAPLACLPGSARFSPKTGVAVCLLPGCQSGSDCPVITATACDTQSLPCPGGQTCSPLLPGATAGRCALPGVCDTASGLCGVHGLGNASAPIGAPCQSDLECAGSMRCERAFDAGGLMHARNGYCTKTGCAFASTLTKAACGAGAACSLLYYGGVCFKSCTLGSASSCRGVAADLYGDYECRAWNNLVLGGVPISATPVCEWGEAISCDFFAGTSLDCSSLGLVGNSTQMSCRGFDGVVKASATASDGYCFDSTSSGTQQRSPLP